MSLNGPIINQANSTYKLDIAYVIWSKMFFSEDMLIAIKVLRIEPQFLGTNGISFHFGSLLITLIPLPLCHLQSCEGLSLFLLGNQ